ncbi:MAG: hypothetical protein K2X39_06980, partial [Silvanigrellaceae bacterium]|nr:hypothetical protein [Silvanigrellaceae bacterium]
LFKSEHTFAISATVKDFISSNSMHIALKIKDGLCDYFNQKVGSRPDVNTQQPDIKIFARVVANKLSISIDTTGEPLSKRGYRSQTTQAPLSENLAHALLRFASWHRLSEGFWEIEKNNHGSESESSFKSSGNPIYQERSGLQSDSGKKIPRQVLLSPFLQDPMCGSGTILIEAALSLLHWKPNARREYFSFFKLNCIEERELGFHYKSLKTQILAMEKSVADLFYCIENYKQKNNIELFDDTLSPLRGSDMSKSAIEVARDCAHQAGVSKLISFQVNDAFQVRPHASLGTLVTNAPYGDRIGIKEDLPTMYRDFSDLWKQKYKNWNIWFMSGNQEAIKEIGLRPTRKVSLFNGSIPCKLLQFIIY